MAVSKVEITTENGVETLMDLTGDTVTPSKMAKGTTAHAADGSLITGTATEVNIVQSEGTSTTDVMSQKVVTDKLEGKADKSSAETWTFTLEDGTTVTKKVVLV